MTFWQWDPPNTIDPNADLTVGVYAVTKDWNQSVVDWTKATGTVNWATAGGDYGKKYGTKVVPKMPVAKFVSYDVKAAVQDWVTNPSSNFGLIFIPEAGNGGDGNDYFSSENADLTKRPKLVITYSGGSTATQPRLPSVAPEKNASFKVFNQQGKIIFNGAGNSNEVITKAKLGHGVYMVVQEYGSHVERRTISVK